MKELVNQRKFYINGSWVDPSTNRTIDVVDPSTEQSLGKIAMATDDDINQAVSAARSAFENFSVTSRDERISLLEAIIVHYEYRMSDLGKTISAELGAPISLSRKAHCRMGLNHLKVTLEVLKSFSFSEDFGSARVVREPAGVCALITPWNWPMNQISCKVAPALAAGCTMILKPSEITPVSAIIFTEILDAAGVPKGVFNLVNGDGPTAGAQLASHPDIDVVSITGSTRAGIEVAKDAAPTVKRVLQELGGKSANIILEDADIEKSISRDTKAVFTNSGQTCNAPTRMLVPHKLMETAATLASGVADNLVVGDPKKYETDIGPLVSEAQFERVQAYIKAGINEGAKLETGGAGRPIHLSRGFYTKPTVFSHVSNNMSVAQEEIFGPVLVIIGYENEQEAIEIANDTPYGLAGFISSSNMERAKSIAGRLRCGTVSINGGKTDRRTPMGGYKHSGNGREHGIYGFSEFLETKSILGFSEMV